MNTRLAGILAAAVCAAAPLMAEQAPDFGQDVTVLGGAGDRVLVRSNGNVYGCLIEKLPYGGALTYEDCRLVVGPEEALLRMMSDLPASRWRAAMGAMPQEAFVPALRRMLLAQPGCATQGGTVDRQGDRVSVADWVANDLALRAGLSDPDADAMALVGRMATDTLGGLMRERQEIMEQGSGGDVALATCP